MKLKIFFTEIIIAIIIIALIYFIFLHKNKLVSSSIFDNINQSKEITEDKIFSDTDKESYENVLKELEKLESNLFTWGGIILQNHLDKCKLLYDKIIHKKTKNIINLYPNINFFRMLKYGCLHDEVIFTDNDIDKIVDIAKKEFVLKIENPITLEKVDTLMLLLSRYTKIFYKLPLELREIVLSLSFAGYISIDEAKLNFRNAIKNNFKIETLLFAISTLKDKNEKYFKEQDWNFKYFIAKYVVNNYDTKVKKEFFDMMEYARVKEQTQGNLDYPDKVYTNLLNEICYNFNKNLDDFFGYLFFREPNISIFNPDKYKDSENDLRERYSLTVKKYEFLIKLWYKIKKHKPDIEIYKRILHIIDTNGFRRHEYKIGEYYKKYCIFYPTKETIETINEYTVDDIDVIKDSIEWSIEHINDSCFIDTKTNYIIQDVIYPDPQISEDTILKRKITKWRCGDVGYGSPTYPTECFLEWDKHKAKFPEYEEMRKQVLSDN